MPRKTTKENTTTSLRVLLSGFEPFAGSRINPSCEVLDRLCAAPPSGIAIFPVVLPVVGFDAIKRLLAAMRRTLPDAVVLLGESGLASGIVLERVAINLRDYRIPDNAGVQVRDSPVVRGGPAAYFSTLPVRRLVAACRAAGVPAELSLSAGSFLCNEVMYAALHATVTRGPTVPTGFIHLPQLPEQASSGEKTRPTMALDVAVKGVTGILLALADRATR
ncbi:MAG: pyroglutamyl-peptidase I [Phycisphaerae bacterium]|nr:pyroglutamyl-peptidase I [Phycisphaerae bacterium]